MLGVNPELINQIETDGGDKHFARHANNEKRNQESEAVEIDASLSQRRAKVVVFALMVGDMRAPKQCYLVAKAVLPVIGKVIKHKGRDPNEGRVCRKLAQLEPGDDKLVNERRKTHNHQTAEGAEGAHR